jgi:hypothetical protein
MLRHCVCALTTGLIKKNNLNKIEYKNEKRDGLGPSDFPS